MESSPKKFSTRILAGNVYRKRSAGIPSENSFLEPPTEGFLFKGWLWQSFSVNLNPKDPTVQKNTTTTQKIVSYYAVVFLLCPRLLLHLDPFLRGESACSSQKICPHSHRGVSRL